MKKIRMDLIEDYYTLYKKRNLSRGNNFQFRKQYEELSLMWMELTDEERTAVTRMFQQENTLID